jgi:hypothetical protein
MGESASSEKKDRDTLSKRHYGRSATRRQNNAENIAAVTNGCRRLSGKLLLAKAEFADDGLIALGIVFLQVVK